MGGSREVSFCLVYWLVSRGRATDRQTERESSSGNREEEEGSDLGSGMARMVGGSGSSGGAGALDFSLSSPVLWDSQTELALTGMPASSFRQCQLLDQSHLLCPLGHVHNV